MPEASETGVVPRASARSGSARAERSARHILRCVGCMPRGATLTCCPEHQSSMALGLLASTCQCMNKAASHLHLLVQRLPVSQLGREVKRRTSALAPGAAEASQAKKVCKRLVTSCDLNLNCSGLGSALAASSSDTTSAFPALAAAIKALATWRLRRSNVVASCKQLLVVPSSG